MSNGILDKARKIRRLIEGATTEHEAQAAILILQQLMASHDLSEEDLGVSDSPYPYNRDDVKRYAVDMGGRREYWKGLLLGVIAENFRCEYYIHSVKKAAWKYEVSYMIVGIDADAQLAKVAFQAAKFAINHLYKIYRSAMPEIDRWEFVQHNISGKSICNSYRFGFINGLDDAFKQQVQELIDDTGKAIIRLDVPAVVTEEMAIMGDLKEFGTKALNGANAAYIAGAQDGYSYGKKRTLSEKGAL